MTVNKLEQFSIRLAKIGIDVKFVGNFPWIYLDKINNQPVTEKFLGNHGFTVMFTPIKPGSLYEWSDLSEIFKIIRKYTLTDNEYIKRYIKI